MKYDQHLTTSARALLAAGKHLQRKDASGDPFELLSQKLGDHAEQFLNKLGITNEKMSDLVARLSEIEKKTARAEGFFGGASAPESWGQQFTQHTGLKGFADEHTRASRFRLQMKTTITGADTSAGALDVPARDATVAMPRRRLTIRNLLPVIRIGSNHVEFPRQNVRTNNAAAVAELATKPESALGFEMVTTNATVIAHWIPASRQILDDAPQLGGIIDSELRYGLALREESQVLYGDGLGANLTGMVPQATAYAAPFTMSGSNMIDIVGLAILQSALADFPADGIVLHPSDWMRMRLLKDADGHYILGDPQTAVTPNLFGLPVVTTPEIALDKFLVGNFQQAATLYDRWEARVEVSTEHADFFTRNLVAILAEERIALAVKQAAALVYGDFGNVV